MYKTILVALDAGPCMDFVSQRAIEQALVHKAKLILCHIKKNRVIYRPVMPGSVAAMTQVIQDHSYSLVDTFEEIKKKALDAGVKEVEILETYSASPGMAIAEVIAPSYDVDLIISGRRDKPALSRVLLGSVSSGIMSHASCDVLLVKNNESNKK